MRTTDFAGFAVSSSPCQAAAMAADPGFSRQERYHLSLENSDAFWAQEAKRLLHWHRAWDCVQSCSFDPQNVNIQWFRGAQLNAAYNCLDRHLPLRAQQVAFFWEPEDPSETPPRALTYQDLYDAVCRAAQGLRALGVQPADRVALYMPMIPEAIIALLACARIGATHTVIFGGFSPAALCERLVDSGAKVLITADAGRRAGKIIPLKANADAAVALMQDASVSGLHSEQSPALQKVVVVRHTGQAVAWNPQQDIEWTDLGAYCPACQSTPAWVEAQHPLFILYTSGSTGTPKGLVHSTGGYLLYAAATFEAVFDYRPGDVYWCAADIGWITGHSYLVYGPMALGATSVLFEGVPSYPDASRIWQVVDKYQVSQLYTAPTLIRALMSQGDTFLGSSSRASLRVLGSVGEPINPEAWHWYHDRVGQGRCAVVDTWWQTETGGHLISPLPGDKPRKAGCATQPFWGIQPALLDAQGQVLEGAEVAGALCFGQSWPGQAITLWRDHPRFVDTYFAPYPGYYYSGDRAMRDAQGDYWLQGRMDDVVNVAGHRLGTAEVESSIAQHPQVAEAAVVGVPHAIKGQALCAYVVLRPGAVAQETLLASDCQQLTLAIQQCVRQCIGGLAVPEYVYYVPELPKTRSGKVMRRLLRQIATGQVSSLKDKDQLGDTSTLVDPSCIESLIDLTRRQREAFSGLNPKPIPAPPQSHR